jgi:hypothetical protein
MFPSFNNINKIDNRDEGQIGNKIYMIAFVCS